MPKIEETSSQIRQGRRGRVAAENAVDSEGILLRAYAEPGFRARRGFTAAARKLVRLPRSGEGPLDFLLPESRWRALEERLPDPEGWCSALSQATGVYFFPSREWPVRFVRYLARLGVRRLLEAGAGRGYLSAALGPLTAAAGIAFLAVDLGAGEFQSELPHHPAVVRGDVFTLAPEFCPEALVYAWPPPGQGLAPLFACPTLRYLFVAGEPGGGVTGAREDWLRLAHRRSQVLSRFSRGRSGPHRHQVTIFQREGD